MKMKKKTSNPKPISSVPHPPYFQMISEAIIAMKSKKGSSQQAISKFIIQNYGSTLPSNFPKNLSLRLRRLADEGRVIKVKNSFRIANSTTTTTTKTITTSSSSNNTSKKIVEKMVKKGALKIKRLSQVKTPEAMEKNTKGNMVNLKIEKKKKMKCLSQVNTPEALKKRSFRGLRG